MAKRPTNAELIQRITELENGWRPMASETIVDHRNQPHDMLSGLTADRVSAAIIAAETGDTKDLFAIYRDALSADSHLQTLFETRFLAVLGDDPTAQPASDSPADKAAAEFIAGQISRCYSFTGLAADLLWGCAWPLALVDRSYKVSTEPGVTFDLGDMTSVPDHLMRWTQGYLEIERVDPATHQPTGVFFRPDPARYITHRGHLLSSKLPDNWGGPMRALLWWFLLKTMDREWWARFLDKFGTPFTVAKFEKNDDRSRQILERALKLSSRIGGLVVSAGTQVELMQANTAAADAHEKFYRLCGDEQAKRILGQTLSSSASPTGLGNGASDLQGQVRGDIRQFDKLRLNATIRKQVFAPLLKINGIAGQPPHLVWGGEEPEENSTTATVLKDLKGAGLRLADKSLGALSKRIGLEIERDPAPEPAPGLPGVKTLSAPLPRSSDPVAAALSISREAAATLSQVYRGSLAPVRQIVLESTSPDDCQAKLLAAFVDWSPTKAAEVVEMAVVAGAFNGLN